MSIYYVLGLSVLFAPITIVLVYSKQGGWKYGFTFIQNSLGVGLFMAFALGFMIGMYHVLSYEIIGDGPLSNYLRSHQKVKVASDRDLDDYLNQLKQDKRNRLIERDEHSFYMRRKVLFSPADHIKVQKKGEEFSLESKPHYRWWFIDFGRNFKHIKLFANQLRNS